MNISIATFYLFLLLSYSPQSESHRKHLLQFSPVTDGSISFIPTSSPSEIPSNSPLASPTPHSSSPVPSNSQLPSPTPPSSSPVPSNSQLPSPTPPSSSPAPPSPFPAWCIAKPTAPADLLQEAMDYACGAGGADCMEIRPGGACFYPDTVISHASFAFNSYWQRKKNSGGSCDFGGDAVVVLKDAISGWFDWGSRKQALIDVAFLAIY
ncbi:glucan endo-1,3-beta-glucosidase 4-like protein [Carex littledalei]|uniref:Glucan endo-1,3-beta-glucosidase 4-like protein n=1 Tax=Carex littledalei TaxID=544730 RepID=A0A833VII1_9POAL|nr:glucan endo-1,3-beta-glucosidase 4-like protein [Carex littledalei]